MFPPLQRRWPTGHIWPLSIKCLAGNKERDLVQHSLPTKHKTLDEGATDVHVSFSGNISSWMVAGRETI